MMKKNSRGNGIENQNRKINRKLIENQIELIKKDNRQSSRINKKLLENQKLVVSYSSTG